MNLSPRAGRRILWALLALGLVVRLPHLGMPPIGVHSWRQSDTAAIARNYREHGYRFGMPQVDWGGAGPGYVESEFPLYPYSASLLYADGKVYVQSEEGPVIVFKPGTKFDKIADAGFKERTLASYAVAESALFIRTADHLFRVQQLQ